MEKRRFEEVSTRDGAEDEETRLKARGDRDHPKKPRGGGLEEAETGQDDGREKAEEEDGTEGGGAQGEAKADGDLGEANGRKSTLPVAVPRDGGGATSGSEVSSIAETPRPSRAEAPRSKPSEVSETYAVLESSDALTGDAQRDKWLERLVQGIRYVCRSSEGDDGSVENGEKGSGAAPSTTTMGVGVGTSNGSRDGDAQTGENLSWPDAAIPAITSLEKAVHETLASDFRKYNQKMRQLDFNLKSNALLAKRLLNGELEPLVIINMTPNELKDGGAAAEKTNQGPEQSEYIQMTDVQCSRCMEKKVGVVEIIHAGVGDRYQLECAACGHAWIAVVDDIAALTIDAPSQRGNVGAAPWATAKFEDVEKKLLSPHESEKPAVDLFRRATAPYVPVLEAHGLELHQPFERTKSQDGSEPAATTD